MGNSAVKDGPRAKPSGSLLDARPSSRRVRSRRWRLVFRAMSGTLAMALVAVLMWHAGVWALERFIYENAVFAVDQVKVETDGHLDPDAIRQWSGVSPETNLLRLDLARVRRDLELMPWIQKAVVERVLPNTLEIEVTERKPVATVHAVRRAEGGRAYEALVLRVDGEGVVLPPRDRWLGPEADPRPVERYPALTGVHSAMVRPGHRTRSDGIRAAARLLEAFEESPVREVVRIQSVDVSRDDRLVVRTRGGGEIVLGMSEFGRQLLRWHAICRAADELGKEVAFLDLSLSNHLPARWQSETDRRQEAEPGRAEGDPENDV